MVRHFVNMAGHPDRPVIREVVHTMTGNQKDWQEPSSKRAINRPNPMEEFWGHAQHAVSRDIAVVRGISRGSPRIDVLQELPLIPTRREGGVQDTRRTCN